MERASWRTLGPQTKYTHTVEDYQRTIQQKTNTHNKQHYNLQKLHCNNTQTKNQPIH